MNSLSSRLKYIATNTDDCKHRVPTFLINFLGYLGEFRRFFTSFCSFQTISVLTEFVELFFRKIMNKRSLRWHDINWVNGHHMFGIAEKFIMPIQKIIRSGRI